MFLLIFLSFLLIIVINYLYYMKLILKAKLTPNLCLPFFGHWGGPGERTHLFYRRLFNYLVNGKNISIFLGFKLLIFLCNIDDVLYLINKESYIQKKTGQYKYLRVVSRGEKMIFETVGDKYKQTKRICMEAVSPTNLKEYVVRFNEKAKTLVDDVKKYVDGEEFDIKPDINFCIISSLLETVLGLDETIMTREEILEYEHKFSKTVEYASNRIYNVVLKSDFLFKNSKIGKLADKASNHTHKITEKLLIKRKEKLEKALIDNEPIRQVFVDKYFLLKKENGDEFSMNEIRCDVIALFGAGFETTVTSIGFAILLLAMNEDIQEKVVEEINEKLKGKEEFSFEHLNEMTYLEMVICESMRLYTPVCYIGRKMTKDLEMPNGGIFQKNTDVYIAINKLHRDPNVYPNPDKFNPENFLPKNIENRLPSTYMPFGFGMRKCFGKAYAMLVMKCVFCHFLRNYKIKTTKTEKDFVLAFEITLKNKKGIPISITSRKC